MFSEIGRGGFADKVSRSKFLAGFCSLKSFMAVGLIIELCGGL